jgi:ATP-binding cassette, subfamily C (CFTR/MRP), member 4
MQLRIATVAAIYSKSLRLSSIGGSLSTSSGQLVNLASNDVERFLFGSLFLPYLFWGPLEAIVILIIGILRIGPSFAAGYAVLFIFVPLQFVLSNQFATIRSQVRCSSAFFASCESYTDPFDF